MDGYIKNKKEAIKSVRTTILYKYAVTFLIVIFIFVWLFAIVANQSPNEWTHIEVVFLHISQERIGLQRGRSHVLNAQNGDRFVINSKYVSVDDLSANLVPGNVYSLVYSNTLAGGKVLEALSDGSAVFQDLNDSISRWESEQREAIIAIIVTFGIEIIALILIDRLWCKKEYAQIRKLKADIERRETRMKNKQNVLR